jgi:hypothetical protein
MEQKKISDLFGLKKREGFIEATELINKHNGHYVEMFLDKKITAEEFVGHVIDGMHLLTSVAFEPCECCDNCKTTAEPPVDVEEIFSKALMDVLNAMPSEDKEKLKNHTISVEISKGRN